MKSIKLLLLSALPLAGLAQGGELKLKGTLKNILNAQWVFVSFRSGEDKITDSIRVEKASFKYKRPLAEAVLATINVRSAATQDGSAPKEYARSVFIEPGSIDVTIDTTSQRALVTGSRANEDFEALNKAQQPYDEQLKPLYNAYNQAAREKNTAARDAAEHAIDSIDNVKTEAVYGSFLKTNGQSPIALYALRQYAGYSIDPDKIGPLFDALPAAQ
ncbi:MAG: DUF4369 domain-containing protein, partial [Sphingobacteriales bacterium]